jgi:hypothetical protein
LIARDGGKQKGCPGPFEKRSVIKLYSGPYGGPAPIQVEVRLGTPPNYNDWSLPAHWNISFEPHTGPFLLFAEMPDSIYVTVGSYTADQGDEAHIPLTLWNLTLNALLGGTTLDYAIDCADPEDPAGPTAEWRTPAGDLLDGPTVEVEWSKVLLDVNGGPEKIKYYQVWRGGEGSPFMTQVAAVAVDGDPETPGFQWYDWLPFTCDVVYRYKIRAVDVAGGYGAFSELAYLQCDDLTSAGDSPAVPAGMLQQNAPNPFNPSTLIRYVLPAGGTVILTIYDAAGNRVRALEQGFRTDGQHEVTWNGLDDSGSPVASGVYFYRLETPDRSEVKRMVLLK